MGRTPESLHSQHLVDSSLLTHGRRCQSQQLLPRGENGRPMEERVLPLVALQVELRKFTAGACGAVTNIGGIVRPLYHISQQQPLGISTAITSTSHVRNAQRS